MASRANDRPASEPGEAPGARIRETYDEYGVGGSRFALIGDPENEHAWVQSDHTVGIER